MTDLKTFAEVLDATWPAERIETLGPWTLRFTKGAGSRVSAATANGAVTAADVDAAEAAMRAAGQTPLFSVRPDDDALDSELAARGYESFDATHIWETPIETLTDLELPRVTALPVWPPLAIQRELWAAGGTGPERIAVMERVQGPKMGILSRQHDKPGGAAFVAVHGDTAMLHSLEIPEHQRRQGLAKWMVRGAAIWAAEQGATRFMILCTADNVAANALYSSLGMQQSQGYHYRRTPN